MSLRTNPRLTHHDRVRVSHALHESLRILGHNPGRALATFFEDQARACEEWLVDPAGTSDEDREAIINLLEIVESGQPIASHPNIHGIKKVAEATRQMANWIPLAPDWTGWEEYGDVFDLLSETLRCSDCYGEMYYNKTNSDTGRQFCWGTIAQALIADPNVDLPTCFARGSAPLGPAPRAEDSGLLSQSVRQVSLILGIDYSAVAWQIIKYYIYLESAGGPKWSLRNGRWEGLASHTNRLVSLLSVMADPEGSWSPGQTTAASSLIRVIRCVQKKWFDRVDTGSHFALSVKAVELSRRMAQRGEARSDTSVRSEPLFDMFDLNRDMLDSNTLLANGDADDFDQSTLVGDEEIAPTPAPVGDSEDHRQTSSHQGIAPARQIAFSQLNPIVHHVQLDPSPRPAAPSRRVPERQQNPTARRNPRSQRNGVVRILDGEDNNNMDEGLADQWFSSYH